MQFETLLFEKRDRVAILTLNRPERLNAINSAMSRELPLAWEAVMRDPGIVVAILTGAGDRALCTGFDMYDFASGRTAVGDPSEAGKLSAVRFTATPTASSSSPNGKMTETSNRGVSGIVGCEE